MNAMEEIREMLMAELEKCSKKGELSAGSLEVIDKLTHAIKSIDTIMAMEGASNEGGSYARGNNARRDSMGRYSNDGYYEGSYARGNRGGGGSNRYGSYARGGSYERGYSREDAKEELAMELRDLKMDAKDSETAHMLDKWIKQLEG